MIAIQFDPQQLDDQQHAWWTQWQKDAEDATAQIIAAWERGDPLEFDSAIWTRLKNWLLDNVFHGKCAYCETELEAARQPGDAEHFRPKGGVNFRDPDADDAPYTAALADDETSPQPQTMKHPGYFWLAYNWKNLLPACNFCNRSDGKKNQFPIAQAKHIFLKRLPVEERGQLKTPVLPSKKWADLYYLAPEDLDALESPCLLHPYFDEPGQHIGFDEFGQVYPREINGVKSQKGVHSIRVYDLKAEALRTERQIARETAETNFDTAVAYFQKLKRKSRADAVRQAWQEEEIVKITSGRTKYSAAACCYLESKYGSRCR